MSVALSVEREAELVALARSPVAAERDAGFQALVRELGPPLLSLCIGVTGQRADGEDALQDALCTIAGGVRQFRGEARLSTWCYRIALHAALRVKASRVRRKEAPATEAPPERAGDHSGDSDDSRRLLEAVAELPIDLRAVVVLFLQGRKHREIAEILEVAEGTVWSRLHAARQRLRTLL